MDSKRYDDDLMDMLLAHYAGALELVDAMWQAHTA